MGQAHNEFEFWWGTSGEWVEPPNVRRNGSSGVQQVVQDGKTLFVKRQTGHLFRSLRYPTGRPTALREGIALSRLVELGVNAPKPVFYGTRKVAGIWQGVLVTEDLGGFIDLDTWYAQGGASTLTTEQHQQLFKRLAQTLARMHSGKWQHGCMRSKHIFIKASITETGFDFELALLDLEKSRSRVTAMGAARHDIPQLRRHSSWDELQWTYFLSCYEQEIGRAV
ncbi:lipopolysaccharide kinase InaA family protein [Pseudomonas sp. EL_65y_Pfl2_R95]|uniref:lipopolysaccharide kinase InaA family protein n=1 Tax=Pseudomonas sp. EL_65y_Pfl2_R95 TaxID=3088698 RepID=UPI0030DBE091